MTTDNLSNIHQIVLVYREKELFTINLSIKGSSCIDVQQSSFEFGKTDEKNLQCNVPMTFGFMEGVRDRSIL
jgi:hypothetical protein